MSANPSRRYQVAAERIGEAPAEEIVAETSARMALPKRRVRLALRAARQLTDDEMEVLEQMMNLQAAGALPSRRRAVSRALSTMLPTLLSRAADPLAELDERIGAGEAARVALGAEIEAQDRREALLQHCLSAADASRSIHRSRQALERLRRMGRVVALRVRNQWRYPRWQFDPDAPGGVVRGLGDVIRRLPLSAAGTAFWLTRPSPRLRGRSPIEALRRNEVDAVVHLAEEHGHVP